MVILLEYKNQRNGKKLNLVYVTKNVNLHLLIVNINVKNSVIKKIIQLISVLINVIEL